MDEKWATILEFPSYQVSTNGEIINQVTGRPIRLSMNRAGIVKVGLVLDGIQYTRSVAVIVAETFVLGRNDMFNTPIHLDGNPQNNRVDNLLWRPRWFAWKYTRQFYHNSIHKARGPIVDLDTKIWYTDLMEAATMNGLLVDEIWRSVLFAKEVFPTRQIFAFEIGT